MSAIAFLILSSRPSTILARMASGFDFSSSRPICTSRSLASMSADTSSSLTTWTSGDAAMIIPSSLTRLWNFSLAATKSVSQLTSSSTPRRAPGWMYCTIAPSAATRPAFLSAPERPFLRSQSIAAVSSPAHSPSAFLQSIMPAPVFWRSALTILAEISPTAAASTSGRRIAYAGISASSSLSSIRSSTNAAVRASMSPCSATSTSSSTTSAPSRSTISTWPSSLISALRPSFFSADLGTGMDSCHSSSR
mmetsp:Transcript_26692/g.79292  ORF Transcript_26692/g.79292 Transcript_26692/m.79292 type:complete len:250 (-) Transcript_26692:3-752(-)